MIRRPGRMIRITAIYDSKRKLYYSRDRVIVPKYQIYDSTYRIIVPKYHIYESKDRVIVTKLQIYDSKYKMHDSNYVDF